MSKIPVEFAAARAMMSDSRPYFTSAVFALTYVEAPGLDTLAVDQFGRVYVDSAVFKKWTIEEVANVLVHEVGHVLRDHCERGKAFPFNTNEEADAEINDDLVEEGLKLPGKPILPSQWGLPNGLLMEEYVALRQKQPQPPPQQGGQGQPQQGQPQPGQPGAGQGQGQGQPGQGQPGAGQAKPGAGDCGSVADGKQRSWELGPPSADGGKDGKSAVPGLDKADIELIKRDVAHRILNPESGRGTAPAGWKRWAKDILEPPIDPAKLIAGAVRKAVSDALGRLQFTFRKPSRRAAIHGYDVVLPGYWRPTPRVAIMIDTSGSMGDVDLGTGLGVVARVLRALNVTEGLMVYACDAAVHAAKKVFDVNQVVLAGGGGTSMTAGIRTIAEKKKDRPEILLVVTDGETDWPAQRVPGMKVIAIITRTHAVKPPDWIRAINACTEQESA